MKNPLLSVCLITYNHEKYIRQAIEGILMQKVNFEWQIFIADDCSTDRTRDILIEYRERFPDLIQLIFQKKNIGPFDNWRDLVSHPDTKYIAYLEGDDYWTDVNKLQKQVDLMEARPDISICSHKVMVLKETADGHVYEQHEDWTGDRKQVWTTRDLLMTGSGGCSCSLVFLTKCVKDNRMFTKILPTDIVIQIACTQFGNLFYMKEIMGVYRRHPDGVSTINSRIRMFNKFGVQQSRKINNYLLGKYRYETDYLLFHYFYPNLMTAYKDAGMRWKYYYAKIRKKLLQIKNDLLHSKKLSKIQNAP